MLRITPFVMGHLVAAVLVGAGAGAFLDLRLSLYFALALLAGAVVSSYVCQWKPGVEAPSWRLYLVALVANPILPISLVVMALDWDCVLGLRRGWNCIAQRWRSLPLVSACCRPSAAFCGVAGSAIARRPR